MKKVAVLVVVTLVSVMLMTGLAQAQGKVATTAQAREMVKKVVDYAKQVGCEKAFAEFNDAKSHWNTTYINIYAAGGDWNGITVVNGRLPVLVGQNHLDLKDADGKSFIRPAIEQCKKTGKAEQTYNWVIAATKTKTPMTLMVEVVDCNGKKIDLGVTYIGKL